MTKTTRTLGLALALLATAAVPTSCDMMHEETDYCPYGLYLTFKYDYNLQRADMFNDHVGSLTLYIFDEQERLVSIREESNTATATPSADATATEAPGRIGHADFMTSRIIFHDDPADDGRLTVTNRLTGVEVATINLPDVLSRLRTSEDIHRYSEQEFLDRGYDYQIDIFLRGDRLAYINISISVLGWSKRVQYEELGL